MLKLDVNYIGIYKHLPEMADQGIKAVNHYSMFSKRTFYLNVLILSFLKIVLILYT